MKPWSIFALLFSLLSGFNVVKAEGVGHGNNGFMVHCTEPKNAGDLKEGLYTVEYLVYRETYNDQFFKVTKSGRMFADVVLQNRASLMGKVNPDDPFYYMATIADKMYALDQQRGYASTLTAELIDFLKDYLHRPDDKLQESLDQTTESYWKIADKNLPLSEDATVKDKLKDLVRNGVITPNCLDGEEVRMQHAALRTEPLATKGKNRHFIHMKRSMWEKLWWKYPQQFSMLMLHEFLWSFVDLDVKKLWALTAYLHSEEFLSAKYQEYDAALAKIGIRQAGYQANPSFFFRNEFRCQGDATEQSLGLDNAGSGKWTDDLPFHIAYVRRNTTRIFNKVIDLIKPWSFFAQRFPVKDNRERDDSSSVRVWRDPRDNKKTQWLIKLGFAENPLAYRCYANLERLNMPMELNRESFCEPEDDATKKYDTTFGGLDGATKLFEQTGDKRWSLQAAGSCLKASKLEHYFQKDGSVTYTKEQVIFLQPTSAELN